VRGCPVIANRNRGVRELRTLQQVLSIRVCCLPAMVSDGTLGDPRPSQKVSCICQTRSRWLSSDMEYADPGHSRGVDQVIRSAAMCWSTRTT